MYIRVTFARLEKKLIFELNKQYPVFNIMSSINNIICEPIFLKGLSEKCIIDIICGNILIFIGINIDELIILSNKLGHNMRWSTKKEFSNITHRIKSLSRELFSHENKGLVVYPSGDLSNLSFVGYGMLIRMIYDHILPSSIIMNRKLTIDSLYNNA